MIVFDSISQVWNYILQLPTSVLEVYLKHFGVITEIKLTIQYIYLYIFKVYDQLSGKMLYYAGCVSLII